MNSYSTSSPDNALIASAHHKFAAIAGAFSLWVFNDNFFKQAVLLMAVSMGHTNMQGYILAVFTLPFLLLAAPAGWLSDRFAKRQVVIGCKWLELAAMLLGAVGMLTQSWLFIFAMAAVMGVQGTLFSPALNGAIPELYPAEYVIRANALLRVASTGAILIGVALSGVVLDCPGQIGQIAAGRYYISMLVLLTALAGLFLSYATPFHAPLPNKTPFPWSGPWNTLKSLRHIFGNKKLAIAMTTDGFIWFLGALQILIVNPLGIQQFGLSKTATSLLIATQLLGMVGGGLLSGRLVTPCRWYRPLAPVAGGLGCVLLSLTLLPGLPGIYHIPLLFGLLGLAGMCAGLLLLPVESFLQIGADPARKGEVWATTNVAVYGGVFIAAPLANLLNQFWQPTTSMGIIGMATLLFGINLWFILRPLERERDLN